MLSQHAPDNHVILYQFASFISGLPVRACACRAALPLCHMIVSNPAGYPFSEHADSAQPSIPTLDTRPSFVRESREGLGPRLRLRYPRCACAPRVKYGTLTQLCETQQKQCYGAWDESFAEWQPKDWSSA